VLALLSFAYVERALAGEDTSQLQEIVVTAEKRTENAKDVPASISLLTGDQIAAQRIANFDDLTRAVPNFSLASGGTEGLSNLQMRGVSASAGAAVVAVFLDETSVSSPGGGFNGQAEPTPFDVARLEVLRGPQGTLYGASSMGGAVRYISNQPKLDRWEVDVTAGAGGTDYAGANYEGSLVVNAPISSTVAARVGVLYGHDAGWIDQFNYLTGAKEASGINSVDHAVVKAALLIQPSDDFTIEPAVWMQRVDSKDSSVWYEDLGLFNTNKQVNEPQNDRLFVPSLTIDKHFATVDLTSITSFFWRENDRQLDGTFFNSGAFAYFFLDPNPVFASHQPQNDAIIAHIASPVFAETKNEQFSQELRATSKKPTPGTGLPLGWTAGLYYSHGKQDAGNTEYAPGLNAAFQSIYGYPLSSPIVQQALGSSATTFENDQIFISPATSTVTEYAAFGEIDYDVLPRLHLSAGLRYEYDTQTYYVTEAGFYGIGAPTPYSADANASATTPRVSAVFDLSDTSTAYATAAKGFRVGGGTGPVPQSVCSGDLENIGLQEAPSTYHPDSLWSYEVGTKLLLADRTLSIDLSAYLIDWKNIQQTIALPSCGFAFTDNFGDARSYGGELQLAYKPAFLRSLTLMLNGGGGRSVITDSSVPTAAAVGAHVLFVPEYTAAVSAEYRVNLNDHASVFARGDYQRIGKSYGSFQATDPDYINPEYGVVNARMGADLGSWQVVLWGKNLTNNQTIIQRPNVASVLEAYTVVPLTVGITISKQFR